MDNEQIQDDKLLMFIRNELSAEEQVQFQEKIKTDSDAQARYEHLLVAQALIWDAGREQEAQELKALYVEEKPAAIQRPLFRYVAMAATILALLAAGYFLSRPQKQSMDSLYASNYQRPKSSEQLSATSGQLQVLDSLAKDANIAYNQANMEEANRLYSSLDTIPGAGELPDYRLFWGIAQLETGKAQAAIQTLGNMTSNFEPRDWYQALAYVKLKDKESAIAVLERILEDSEHFYYEKADKLMKQLE